MTWNKKWVIGSLNWKTPSNEIWRVQHKQNFSYLKKGPCEKKVWKKDRVKKKFEKSTVWKKNWKKYRLKKKFEKRTVLFINKMG